MKLERFERRRLRQPLRDSAERFQLLVESIKDYAIIMLDTNGCVVSWNAGAARIKGYTSEEIIGRHFSRFYVPEATEGGGPAIELQRARDEGRFEDDGWRQRKDGSRFWANVVITALHDDSGTLRGYAKITRDLTAQQKESAQPDPTAQRLTEFIAVLAHELRNPLAPIGNAAYALGNAPADPSRTLRAARIIERQVKQLTRLVDDLLDVGRISTGKIVIAQDIVSVDDVVARAVENTRTFLEAKQQQLSVDVRDSLLVRGDLVRLAQAVGSLLHNASKFTPPRGVISVLVEDDDQARIHVRDNGIGLSEELLDHAFDLFVQGDIGIERTTGGLGVGLTLARRLVEMHGGEVLAASAGEGAGSEFTVVLPMIGSHRERAGLHQHA